MSYYKDTANKLHCLENDAYVYLLPSDAIQITEAEADAIRAANTTAPTPVYTCSPWQIRKALNALGLRDAVENAVKNSTDQTLKDGWEFATQFSSNDPFVIGMGAALGKTPEEIAALIQHAFTL